MHPVDAFPLLGAVFTDGSVAAAVGAAAVQPDTDKALQLHVPEPQSMTHCELLALALALGLETPQVVTDSLTSLRLLSRWPLYSTARILRCADRVEVRHVLHLAAAADQAPLFEKVKAHDECALWLRHPKAVGNDLADTLVQQAACGADVSQLAVSLVQFEDPVLLLDACGQVVRVVSCALQVVAWRSGAR